ncbi:uncharacterized protein METZ01_LOCUS119350, partial [marine metagenome]
MTDEKDLSENEIIALRRAALDDLRKEGNPFPNDFRRKHLAAELHERFDDQSKEELEVSADQSVVAG